MYIRSKIASKLTFGNRAGSSQLAGQFVRFNTTKTTPISTSDSTPAQNPVPTPKSSDEKSKKDSSKSTFFRTGGIFILGSIAGAGYISLKVANETPEFLFPSSSITRLQDTISPTYGNPSKTISELTALLGPSKITTSKSVLDDHSDTYWSTHHATESQRPDCIVYPESTEEVSEIMKICHKNKVPVIPFSGGTSLEGQFIPTRNGICIDLGKMNKVLALHKEDLDIVVQPTVGWEELRDYLDDFGLLFGPDPGPGACIGGMVGTSCSGPNAARYGTMKENVLSVTVVLADGTIIKTKKRPRKSSAGYNLTGLFIGSEGTLGIVTETTLKLHVKPKFENVAVVSFPDLRAAANTVAELVQQGIAVNALEFLDKNMMKFVNFSGETSLKYDELPTLMLKLGGNSKESAHLLTKTVQQICKENGNKQFRFAESEEEKFELWNARKVALWSTINYGKSTIDPDIQVWTTDVAVPISRLCDSLETTQKEIAEAGLTASIVGHAGDGNYHALILFKNTPEEYLKTKELVQQMVTRAIEAEGTVTGEHGVGYGKRAYLLQEAGEETVGLMRKVKYAIDPLRILNPDKVFITDPNEPVDEHTL
ncbi:hypothetical protein CANARDRAFT_10278 [[Candida] arabinofermentans NRRL YB-2248]|uniref:D-lactate dehydrogenase (cytochrome) n=1 Tax=[Candida] arabinofermentans NRRL YB-2248 TaxID=983967 RepID=A0A1E4STB8_9ASCO|nr:hypothetical protein CANARDRAFT_10278 [[Candida] arabinofermentans NRRL YB-2248]